MSIKESLRVIKEKSERCGLTFERKGTAEGYFFFREGRCVKYVGSLNDARYWVEGFEDCFLELERQENGE